MNAVHCPSCYQTRLREDAVEGKVYCLNCGTIVSETVLQDEVGFAENSAGAATALGTRIAAGATGATFGKHNRFGGNSHDFSEKAGKARCMDVARIMGVGEGVGESAGRVWFMAYQAKFTRGRRGELVVGACVYLAGRIRRDPPPLMLIDFADRLNDVNVFDVGAIYLKLLRTLNIKDALPIDPSIYIHRFASLLEFGDDLDQVKSDATRLVQRFSRDWMTTGRKPSGICGAALILAARMNNYRRSVAEVVQVVKIADVTIKKRLEEFQRSATGKLTVAEFRDVWLDQAENPPAFTKNREIEEVKAAEEARSARAASASTVNDEDEEVAPGSRKRRKGTQVPSSKGKRVKLDRGNSNGSARSERHESPFPVIPKISSSAAGPGPSTMANMYDEEQPDEPDPNEEIVDAAVENVLTEVLQDDEVANELQTIEQAKQEELQSITQRRAQEEDDPLKGLDEDELDEYLLDEVSAKIKMHTWISVNMDYLEKLQEKLRRQKLDELQEEAEADQRKPRVRRGPVGPAESAAAAARGLLERKNYSRNVNYAALEGLFKSDGNDDGEEREDTPLADRSEEKTDEKDDGEEDGKDDHVEPEFL